MELEVEVVDSTTLDVAAADEMLSIPGDNPSPSEVTCVTRFVGTVANPALRTVETITITFPKETSGSTTARSIAGTGFITAYRHLPNLQRNQLNEGMIRFKFDGTTGPTTTVES
jgi:hypothetical protein